MLVRSKGLATDREIRMSLFRRNEHKHDRAPREADGEDEELAELAELERLEAAGPLDDTPLDAPQQQDPRHDGA
jgi:hypothetical protein